MGCIVVLEENEVFWKVRKDEGLENFEIIGLS